MTIWRWLTVDAPLEPVFRETMFNVVSVVTGTGFFTGSFTSWGGFLLVVTFLLGLLGGCSGSSSGALTIFRVQVAISAVRAVKAVCSRSVREVWGMVFPVGLQRSAQKVRRNANNPPFYRMASASSGFNNS